jgi:hypothetical protein
MTRASVALPAVALLLLGGLGCARSPARVPAAAIGAAAAAPAPPATPPCDLPELWLAIRHRDELPAAYCDACGPSCTRVEGRLTMPWGFLEGDPMRFGCFDLEYASVAVPAFHGKEVPARWAEAFAGQPWYAPDPGFQPDRMPAAARDNAAWLATATEICTRSLRFTYAAAYVEPIRRWFADRERGQPELPALLFVDGKPATASDFLAFLGHGEPSAVFRLGPRTRIEADAAPAWWTERLGGRFTLLVTVATGGPTLSCLDRSGIDCEGYDSVELFFDPQSDELVAIHLTASG